MTCSEETGREKLGIFEIANQYGFAVVFPDTSPRNVDIEGVGDTWEVGYSAGYFVNATE